MINIDNIDLFYDKIDEACLIIYEQLQLDYLDCLIRVGNDILHGLDESGLEAEDIIRLEEIYYSIINHSFLNEEVRQAMELLIIKAFKHNSSYPLDLMTPDSICYLIAFLIGLLFDKSRHFNVLDIGVGTGNLLNAVSNFLTKENYELSLTGIEREQKLALLSQVNTDLQGNQMQIILNDAVSLNYIASDVIIGDLDSYFDNEYYPYQIVSKYLNNLNENGIFIYLINNDFFNQKGINEFRENFSGTLLGLIVLPDILFKENIVGKSLLIGTNAILNNYEIMVMNLASINETELTQQGINNITNWINDLKGLMK